MTNATTAQIAANEEPWLEVTTSRNFCDWLARENISLAFSTYQAAKFSCLAVNRMVRSISTNDHCSDVWGFVPLIMVFGLALNIKYGALKMP